MDEQMSAVEMLCNTLAVAVEQKERRGWDIGIVTDYVVDENLDGVVQGLFAVEVNGQFYDVIVKATEEKTK